MHLPCEHPDPAATASECRLCFLYTTREDYRKLWSDPVPPRPPVADGVRVWRCCGARAWDWVVTRDGSIVDRGTAPTEAEARVEAAEAEAAVDAVTRA
jgi:hypothetical protein